MALRGRRSVGESAARGHVFAQKAGDFLDALQELAITIDHAGADLVLTDVHRVAVTYGITGYDAAYLELALRGNLPLATLDAKLRQACLRAGGAVHAA